MQPFTEHISTSSWSYGSGRGFTFWKAASQLKLTFPLPSLLSCWASHTTVLWVSRTEHPKCTAKSWGPLVAAKHW